MLIVKITIQDIELERTSFLQTTRIFAIGDFDVKEIDYNIYIQIILLLTKFTTHISIERETKCVKK